MSHIPETIATESGKEEEKKPVINDPSEFMHKFRESSAYKTEWDHFFEGKQLAPTVTEERKRQVFEQNENASVALVLFARDEVTFRYEPKNYPEESRKAIREHIKSAEEFKKYSRTEQMSRDNLLNIDEQRRNYHREAARKLVEDKIMPNEKLARGFARLVLIDQGLANWDYALESDKERLERAVKVRNA